MTTDTAANKELIRAFVAAWNDRDFAAFDRLMADDAVLTVGGSTISCNAAATRAIASAWTTAFPDWRFDLISLVAEGDRVAAHLPYSGTFTQPFRGIAPTGKFARVDEMVIFRVADGRVAEAWKVFDEMGMWRQLGIRPDA